MSKLRVLERASNNEGGPSARREKILVAAGDLFRKRGYYGSSIDDIGEAAGVTGPAVYYHFKSKDALLLALAEQGAEQVERDLQAILGEGLAPTETLKRFVETSVRRSFEQRNLIAAFLHEADHLPASTKGRVRRMRQSTIDAWVSVLKACRPELSEPECLALFHGALQLIRSIGSVRVNLGLPELQRLFARATLAALLAD